MEYDVVRTLKVLGHEIRVIGVHDDLTPIKKTMDEFKPTITFNLMEAFDDIIVFDQNVVSYLELLKVPYTGCNPRGLTLSRDKALAKKLMAYHRIPVPDFLVVPLGGKDEAAETAAVPADRQVADLRILDRHFAGVGRRQRRTARQARAVHPRHDHDAGDRRGVHRRPRALCRRDGQRSAADVPGLGNVVLRSCRRTTGRSPPSASSGASSIRRSTASTPRWRGCRTIRRRRCSTCSKRVYRALDLSGYARVDLRMKENGEMFVIEANPNPQLAQGEDFAESAQRAGVSYAKLIERIINLGLQWQPSRMA